MVGADRVFLFERRFYAFADAHTGQVLERCSGMKARKRIARAREGGMYRQCAYLCVRVRYLLYNAKGGSHAVFFPCPCGRGRYGREREGEHFLTFCFLVLIASAEQYIHFVFVFVFIFGFIFCHKSGVELSRQSFLSPALHNAVIPHPVRHTDRHSTLDQAVS